MEKTRILNRIGLFLLLLTLGLAYLAWTPRNMSSFSGYEDEPMTMEEATRFSQSASKKLLAGNTIKINERDLNRYLNAVYKLEHSLALRPWITSNGIYVDLKPDHASICIERSIDQRIHQSEITLEIRTEEKDTEEQYSKKLIVQPKNGTVGKLKMPSRFAASLNGWFNVFSGETLELLRSLGLQFCNYSVIEGELVISPGKKTAW